MGIAHELYKIETAADQAARRKLMSALVVEPVFRELLRLTYSEYVFAPVGEPVSFAPIDPRSTDAMDEALTATWGHFQMVFEQVCFGLLDIDAIYTFSDCAAWPIYARVISKQLCHGTPLELKDADLWGDIPTLALGYADAPSGNPDTPCYVDTHSRSGVRIAVLVHDLDDPSKLDLVTASGQRYNNRTDIHCVADLQSIDYSRWLENERDAMGFDSGLVLDGFYTIDFEKGYAFTIIDIVSMSAMEGRTPTPAFNQRRAVLAKFAASVDPALLARVRPSHCVHVRNDDELAAAEADLEALHPDSRLIYKLETGAYPMQGGHGVWRRAE